MAPLPYSKLVSHKVLGPQKSNGVRKRSFPHETSGVRENSWPSICQGKGPRGLPNPHNYCYRRSVLQALLHLPALIRVLEVHKPTTPLCDPQQCTCVACGLKKLSATYWTSESRDSSLAQMVRIFDKLINDRARSGGTKFMWSDTKWSKGWHFTDQMDAHEFMGFLLDQLHDPRMPKKLKAASSKDTNVKSTELKLDATSFKAQLEDTFQLLYRQRMKCHHCGLERDLHNQQKILGPLPLATSRTSNARKDISSLLAQFFSTDAWEIKCENKACSKFEKPKLKNRISQSIVAAPEVLMIQLKCFRNQGKVTSKKNPNISYGHWLDLSKHASPDLLKKEGDLKYKLASVILHQGSSLEAGHYVGSYMGPNGAHHISDERVQKTSPSALLPDSNMKGTPYILTYVRARAGVDGDQIQGSQQLPNSNNPVVRDLPTSKPQHLAHGLIKGMVLNSQEVRSAAPPHDSSSGNDQRISPMSQTPSVPISSLKQQHWTNGAANGKPLTDHDIQPTIQPTKSSKTRISPSLVSYKAPRVSSFKLPQHSTNGLSNTKLPNAREAGFTLKSNDSPNGNKQPLPPGSQSPLRVNPFKMPLPSTNGSKSAKPLINHEVKPFTEVSQKPTSNNPLKTPTSKTSLDHKKPSAKSLTIRDGRPSSITQHTKPEQYQGLSKSAIRRMKKRQKRAQMPLGN